MQHPHTAFTFFDEMVLSFGKSFGLNLSTTMQTLQLVFRVFLLSGFFLIARSLGCSQEMAAAVSALMMLGGRVLGVQTLVVEYEPVPRGMAFALILLGLALLSRRCFFSGTLGVLRFLHSSHHHLTVLDGMGDNYVVGKRKTAKHPTPDSGCTPPERDSLALTFCTTGLAARTVSLLLERH